GRRHRVTVAGADRRYHRLRIAGEVLLQQGSAIGGSFAEAAVHSLNEAIERDAISLFLIQTFLAAQPTAPA
ncbi:YcaO-like family protein, partial [Mycobacterium szulgai]|uniref:YcaO-like family protein n=1 Tax=Mycobacterium szulgai TaxID=1787 RepID=UPI0021F259B0